VGMGQFCREKKRKGWPRKGGLREQGGAVEKDAWFTAYHSERKRKAKEVPDICLGLIVKKSVYLGEVRQCVREGGLEKR